MKKKMTKSSKLLLLTSVFSFMLLSYVGQCKTVYADKFGFNSKDVTSAVQKAIDSGATKIIFTKKTAPWIVHKTINLKSNQMLYFEPGVCVKAAKGKFKGRNECLFSAVKCKGITLSGYGAVLEMRKTDYWNAKEYCKSEWRHGISIYDCENIKIEGITVKNTGGDGIYLGAGKDNACHNIEIIDVVCDSNHRQGISVISVENLLIERCSFLNTAGTDPMAGIDFEPNQSTQKMKNIIVKNCYVANNKALGLHVWLNKLNVKTEDHISILFENCVVEGGQASAHVGACQDNGPQGEIVFKNCIFTGASQNAIRLRDKSSKNIKVVFENCVIRDVGTKKLTCRRGKPVDLNAPVAIFTIYKRAKYPGGVYFKDCLIVDKYKRPFMIIADPINFASDGFSNIYGSINLINPVGGYLKKQVKINNLNLKVKGIKK